MQGVSQFSGIPVMVEVIIAIMAKFYTRTGDDGFTNLLGEGRVPKYHPRPETVGVIDEATAALGLGRANCISEQTQRARHSGKRQNEEITRPDQMTYSTMSNYSITSAIFLSLLRSSFTTEERSIPFFEAIFSTKTATSSSR